MSKYPKSKSPKLKSPGPKSPGSKSPKIYIIMEEIVSVSENNEIIGLRNFHRLLFGFRLQTPPPVNHPGTATTTNTEKFEIADIICKQ